MNMDDNTPPSHAAVLGWMKTFGTSGVGISYAPQMMSPEMKKDGCIL